MRLSLTAYLILFPLIFLAALVDAIGGGGGLISIPAYLLVGLDYGTASGTNKLSASLATTSSVIRFWKSGKVCWLPALFAIIGALPGAYMGTRLSLLLGDEIMRVFMICATPCVAAAVFLKRNKETEVKPMTKLRLFLCAVAGLIIGMYDGFFGPGTGTFLILLLSSMIGMDTVSASATAKPVNLASNISSLITRIFAGQVWFTLAIAAAVFSIAGAQLGTVLALTKGAKFIRYVMIFVLALLVIKLITEMI